MPTHKWSELDHKAMPEQISAARRMMADIVNGPGVRVKNDQTGEFGILTVEPHTSKFIWMIYTAEGHELGFYTIEQFQREGWNQA